MPNLFSLIGSAWDFYKSNPVLNIVTFWLLFLPMLLLDILDRFLMETEDMWLLAFVIVIVLSLVIVWGQACVLTLGKKLLGGKGGSKSVTFAKLRGDASKLIVPLFFTEILFSCITLLWALLLIIPGIIYGVRAGFYPIVIATEGKAYREALQKSYKVVHGNTWTAFWYLLGLGITVFIPVILPLSFLEKVIETFDARLLIASAIIMNGISSVVVTLFMLCIIVLYGELKKLHKSS